MDRAAEDRAFRESLERQSVPMARADRVGNLNKLAAGDVLQRSVWSLLVELRANAQGRRRIVNDLNSRHDAYDEDGGRKLQQAASREQTEAGASEPYERYPGERTG